jgi:uncharacterized membrane protein
MGIRIRVWIGILTLALLSTFVVVPVSEALPDPCDACGAGCYRTYQAGWNDCYGSPSNCYRETTCG